MGKYWLHDLIPVLANEFGSEFYLYPGAETRSRSSGGFDAILGVLMHHDADPVGGSDLDVLRYEYVNATDKPIGNLHVTRSGLVTLGACGASNHAGKGGPVSTSKGTVPLNKGNQYLIGIEASNNGVGEIWNDKQLNNYLRLVTVLCKHFGFDPLRDIYGHWTYCEPSCPGRKRDPAGPTPKYPAFGGTSGRKSWDMQAVRKEVKARLTNTPAPPATIDYRNQANSWTTPPATLKYGNVHPNVPWLQGVLCSMNTLESKPMYNPAWVGADMVNGKAVANGFGDATKAAVVYFQTVGGQVKIGSQWVSFRNELTGDGVYGSATASRMLAVRGK